MSDRVEQQRNVVAWLERKLDEEKQVLAGLLSGKPKRAASEAEKLYDDLEFWRQERCTQLGLEAKISKRPHPARLNMMVDRAWPLIHFQPDPRYPSADRAGHVEQIFKCYLATEFGRVDERQNSKPRDPPWPIELFFASAVFAGYARDYESGKAEPWRPPELANELIGGGS